MDVAMSKVDHGLVFLPDDILLNIFKRIPDVFLRYKAKHVCRRWFNIITNIILLDHASFILEKKRFNIIHTACLVDIAEEIHTACLVDIAEEGEGLKVKEKNLVDIPSNCRIKSWYNEFLLLSDFSKMYVFNLITKETFYLPQKGHRTSKCRVALFFDEFKGVYKVVHFCMDPTIQFHILILGRYIDSDFSSFIWKKMEVPGPLDKENRKGYRYNPISVQVQGRYFHCTVNRFDYLVSVDMAKEEIFQISLPGSTARTSNLYSIFEMGGFLTLIDRGGVGAVLGKADLWILKDFQRMKWEKLQSIVVPCHLVTENPGNYFVLPVCGVISKRYIIFRLPRSRMCSYDLNNGVMKELNINFEPGSDCIVVNSSAPSII